MHSLLFGNPDQAWQQYDITQYPLMFNDQATTFKAIVRKDRLVAVLGKGYYLFPNEEALKIATQAAELAGLQAFTPVPKRGLKQKGNVFFNKDDTLMHAWFAPEGSFSVEGDKMHIGCDVSNSIDGSSSFGCSIFTYRSMCSNGVIFGYKEIAGFKKMHTKGLDPIIKTLKDRMLSVMDKANDTLESYRTLAQQRLTNELIDKIRQSRVPKKVLPDYIKEPQAELPQITQWQLYNDITEAIWHNTRSDLRTKTFQFQTLHAILKV